MLRYCHAAAFIVGTFLIFPTLSSAQGIDLDLPSFDVSVSVDIPDVGAHVPDFTGFNDSEPGIASGNILDEADPGVALLELLAVVEEEVRKGMTKPELIEELIREPIEAARPKVKEIVVVGSKVKEVVRRGLQQGRILLDSDFGP